MHRIRRSGARAMSDHLALDLGNDKALLQVSVMLNHSGTQQTLAYIGLDIEREQLNDWLRGISMYSPAAYKINEATVTAIRPVTLAGGVSLQTPAGAAPRPHRVSQLTQPAHVPAQRPRRHAEPPGQVLPRPPAARLQQREQAQRPRTRVGQSARSR